MTASSPVPRAGGASRSGTTSPGSASPPHDGLVAVVSLSGRFPGAPDLDAYWDLLREGRSGLTRFTDADLAAAGVAQSVRRHPAYVPVGGLIEGQDRFDPDPFGFTDAEAALLDPQHRLFLESSWDALDRAGHGGGRGAGAVGVFAGAMHSAYLAHNLPDRWDTTGAGSDPLGSMQTALATHADYLPLQVAHRLGLSGPALAVASACSTSLVAVHLAVQSLLAGESDTALAGGVSLIVPQGRGYRHVPGGIYATDGVVRPFSADGSGVVHSQGVGVVVLRRLADAVADGDPVLAVVHGSAVGNDGPDSPGFTAPSVRGQARTIAEALAVAGISPREVGLVEAHGTATPLGDPVELEALRRVFGDGPAWCGLGSVKGSIGHANTAAGIASLIKAVLAVQHRTLPASLHARPLNPALRLDGSPFAVVEETRGWDTPPYAGISSFGIGGTNCHIVIGPAPSTDRVRPPAGPPLGRAGHTPGCAGTPGAVAARPVLLTVSAATAEAARATAASVARSVADADLADAAHTLAAGRAVLPYRVAGLGAAGLAAAEPVRAGTPRVLFAFPGAGSPYPGMGADLYRDEPVFTAAVDACADALAPHLGADVREALDPAADPARVADPAFGLPALFAVQVGVVALLASWGVRPDALVGHSLGECTAAHVSGALPLADAARLVAARCRAASRAAGGGAMLAVGLDTEALRDVLAQHPELDLAAVNAPGACTVTGPADACDRLAVELRGSGVRVTPLRVAAAMHSRAIDPELPGLITALTGLAGTVSAIPVVSAVSGEVVGREFGDPEHWARQLREPVRFSDALRTALDAGDAVLVEIGPGTTLGGLARRHAHPHLRTAVPTLEHDVPDAATLRAAAGALWAHGADVDVAAVAGPHPAGRRRIALPGYAFQRRRFWIDPPTRTTAADDHVSAAEPFQLPGWEQLPPLPADGAVAGEVLVLGDGPLAAALRARHAGRPSTSTTDTARDLAVVPPQPDTDGGSAAPETAENGTVTTVVLVLEPGATGAPDRAGAPDAAGATDDFGAPGASDVPNGHDNASATVARTATALAAVAEAARHVSGADRPALLLVTRSAEQVAGDPATDPATAAAVPLPRILGQETPGLRWASVDLGPASPAAGRDADLHADLDADLDAIDAELAALLDGRSTGRRLARRGPTRWAHRTTSWSPGTTSHADGPVLVLGGLGPVGRLLAGRLTTAGHRVVVTSRDPGRHDAAPPPGVEVRAGDVTDPGSVAALLAELSAGGPLALVVHAAGVVAGTDLEPLRHGADPLPHLRAKLGGALALRAAVAALPEGRRPRRVVLMSSAVTLLGGVGTGAYAAANAAMDAVTTGEPGWTSVLWDGWSVAADGSVLDTVLGDGAALDAPTGTAAFDRVLSCPAPIVAVASTDLAPRIAAASAPRQRAAAAGPGLTGVAGEVAELWTELFGTPVTSGDDDFFALGGHSLLGTRMLAALGDRHGVTLRLRDLLTAPTVAGLARLLGNGDGDGDGDGATAGSVDSRTGGTGTGTGVVSDRTGIDADGTFPMTRVQHAYWIGRDGGYAGGDVPCHFYLEYEATGLDLGRYEDAWNAVLARHPMLRAVATPTGRLRVLDDVPRYRIRIHDLTAATGERRTARLQRVREQVRDRPGPADRWPLVQVQAARLPDGRVRLFLGVDVLVCDAASWWIVETELRDHYRGTPLPPAPVLHPAACAAALERRRASPEGERAAAYWRARLDGLTGPPGLPVLPPSAEPGPPMFTRRSARLPAGAWAALRAEAARHRVTPAAVLLTVYTDALADAASTPAFRVALTTFDRPDLGPEVQRVVGDFTSLVLHEVPADRAPTFAERAAATQRRMFTELDHRAFSALDVLAELSSRTGTQAAAPVVFTSALGMAAGGADGLEWVGEQVHAASRTPQTWLDHQVLEVGGELRLQWDGPDGVLPDDLVDALVAHQEQAVRRLAADPAAWTTPRTAPRSGGRSQPDPTDVLLPLRRGEPGGPVLLLVHPSGGDVLCYADLSRSLDPRVVVVGVMDPELTGGAPGPETVAGIAAQYLAAARELGYGPPWLLGGWSMGGTVAQEMAAQLHAAGEPVGLLAMLDSNDATHIRPVPGSTPEEVELEVTLRHLRAIGAFLDVELDTGALAGLPAADRPAAVAALLRAHRLAGRGESDAAVRARTAVFARHLRALAAHTPTPLGDARTPTLLVRADRLAPANSGVGMGVDDTPPGRGPDLGWSAHLAGPIEVVGVDAHHYDLLRPPALPRVAAALDAAVSTALTTDRDSAPDTAPDPAPSGTASP